MRTWSGTKAGQVHVISGMVQAACLTHDIGNPPFGHSGEAAIGDWFREKFTVQKGIFGGMDEKKAS
ncbi:MAG: HD domain-containing protein [Rhodobacteraceae bacterium]|nr:HD domain-containing protein [Paracoccaceae bacterium]